jgi:hypothetical protein
MALYHTYWLPFSRKKILFGEKHFVQFIEKRESSSLVLKQGRKCKIT